MSLWELRFRALQGKISRASTCGPLMGLPTDMATGKLGLRRLPLPCHEQPEICCGILLVPP